jgi:hypothetical protein
MFKKASWISTRKDTNGFWYYTTPDPSVSDIRAKIDQLLEMHGISKTNIESDDGLTFTSTLEFQEELQWLNFVESLRNEVPEHQIIRNIFYSENQHKMIAKFFDGDNNLIEETIIYV